MQLHCVTDYNHLTLQYCTTYSQFQLDDQCCASTSSF